MSVSRRLHADASAQIKTLRERERPGKMQSGKKTITNMFMYILEVSLHYEIYKLEALEDWHFEANLSLSTPDPPEA